MVHLTLYSKPGCHLCDEMKALVARLEGVFPLLLESVDISTDPALEARYGLEIPVLFVEGKKVAKYRISEQELLRMLADRTRGSGGSGKSDRPGG